MGCDKETEKIDINIIIPVYGVEKYIERFMKCLIAQTIQNYRAIFVNDKTIDNSMKIIERYRSFLGDRLVEINNLENLGLSGARNVGLDYAENHPAKYITFLDPDDWMEPDYLEDLYFLSEKHGIDLCISGLVRSNEESGKTICVEMVNMRSEVFKKPDDCDELAFINPCAYAKMYLHAPIKHLRFREIKRSEDTCFLFEALMVYRKICFTNNARYHYCVRGTSLTGTINEEKYLSMHNEFAKILPQFEITGCNGLYDKFVSQIFIRSSLGGVCRLCFRNMRLARKMERIEYEYLENNIPSWRHNKYLTFGHHGIGGLKEFALKVTALMYKMHIFVMFIWLYYIMTKVLGKDIRA